MKNYKFWLTIVLTLLVVNSVVLAIMWFHKHPQFRHRPVVQEQSIMEPKDVLINTLAFTPKQVILFDTLRYKHRQLVNKLDGENHILRDSLFNNIKKPKADTALINAIAKHISDNQSQIEKATLYHFREVRAILTPTQQIKFDGIISEVLQMMGRPGPPHGNGMGRDGKEEMQGPPMDDRMPPGRNRHRRHFGPPPEGMPPLPMDKDGHRLPPPDGRPPGPDGRPPYGPPPGGGPPPNGPPPDGRPPQ
jgi:Spy/CpxP family protein refolding chaperone